MRCRVGIFVICLMIVAALALAGSVCLAYNASVTVQVTVPRLIHVSGNGVGRSNVEVVRLDGPESVTYVVP